MSQKLLYWAYQQKTAKPSEKFLLVTMAALSGGACYASIPRLAELTGQNPKTVRAGLRALAGAGLIGDTGQRAGKTGQIIVWKFNVIYELSTGNPQSYPQGYRNRDPLPELSCGKPPKDYLKRPLKGTEIGTQISNDIDTLLFAGARVDPDKEIDQLKGALK